MSSGEDGIEADDVNVSTEEREVRKRPDPRLPNSAEIEKHNMTHLPYRCWCRHCVRGRAKEMAHMASKGDAGDIPEVHFDFCFPGGEEPGTYLTILVGRIRHTRMTMSSVMPSKSTGEFIAKRVIAFLRECGIHQTGIIVKCDQEAALSSIMDKVREIQVANGVMTPIIPEYSPVGSKQSNGVVERGIQAVEGQVRTMRDALEERLGVTLEIGDTIWPWLVEYAGHLLNRHEVGHDGKTAYERLKGKQATTLGIEFGESVHWKKRPTKGQALSKLAITWSDGIFLGVKGVSGEVMIGTPIGCYTTRTVMRKPIEQRWNAEEVRTVLGTPWRKSEEDPNVDGEKLRSRELTIEEKEHLQKRLLRNQNLNVAPKQFCIRIKDVVEYGPTPECRGCSSLIAGRSQQNHTGDCRQRFRELLADDPRIEAAKIREKQYTDNLIEEECKRVREKEEKRDANKRRKDPQGPDETECKARRGDNDNTIRVEEMPDTGGAASSAQGTKRGRGDTEDLDNEGDPKRLHVNLLEGLQAHTSTVLTGVNDDEDERAWCDRGVCAVEYPNVSEWFYDELTGEVLDAAEVRASRAEEIKFIKDMPVYVEDTIQKCWELTGKKPIGTRWVDTRKGDGVRSRLVAQDVKPKGDGNREDLFAAMPPLEAKKILFQEASRAIREPKQSHTRMKLMFIDVRKAHLNAACEKDDVFVALPAEAGAGENMCGRLLRWLYGMRGAAQGWEREYSDKLAEVGFIRGVSNPCVFYRPKDHTRLVVHGDDFTFLGVPNALDEMLRCFRKWWDIKLRGVIGNDTGDIREIDILNRKLIWDGDKLTLTADQRHREVLCREMGIKDNSKGVTIPCEDDNSAEDTTELLDSKNATKFRSMAARVNYLSLDRPDLQFAAKRVCQGMANPTMAGMMKLKRVARYLASAAEGTLEFGAERGPYGLLRVYVDSDWAGCKTTRKSTSGGMAVWCGGLVKSWSRTQGSIALSSGEAEFYAAVKGVAEGLGIQSLMRDLGINVKVEIVQDSTSAKGTLSRNGVGKIKHLDTNYLWVQEVVKKKGVTLTKILGTENPADVLTKPSSVQEVVRRFAGRIGYNISGGGSSQ